MGDKPTYLELEQKIKQLTERNAERNQFEKIMQECEQRFQSLYDRTPCGYQSLDANGCLLEVNDAWLDMLGYTRQEVVGCCFGDFLHPELQKCFKENFPRFMAVGEILGVECEMLHKDGSIVSVFFNGTVGRDESGNFMNAHCVLHDITVFRQAEEEKERLSEELQSAQAEIKTLRGILPLCSRCGTSRIDQELNKKMQTYMEQHTEAELRSCLCQSCKAQNSSRQEPG